MPDEDQVVRVINTSDLIDLNQVAMKLKLNRHIDPKAYDLIDPDGIHVVTYHMIHNDDHMRVVLAAKFRDVEAPVTLMLDMPFQHFDRLAKIRMVDGGWQRVS